MGEYVEIRLRRNRGWPWPEDSWGLTSMFGEDGWCRSCGVPQHPQTGSIVLQQKGLAVEGGWVPNWQFDVYCLARGPALEAVDRFGVGLVPVCSPSGAVIAASQIVIPTAPAPWFDQAELNRLIEPIHPEISETGHECGITRWMPVGMDALPPPPAALLADEPPVIASPEWFGGGTQSFHQVLWRRDVAEFLVASSPKDFTIEVSHDR